MGVWDINQQALELTVGKRARASREGRRPLQPVGAARSPAGQRESFPVPGAAPACVQVQV